jgi:diguanylate cyclase (GGDEF)-like protein/PAS domain S-box-containing protein
MLPRLSPAARIAMGLVSLTAFLLLTMDLVFGLIPSEADIQRRIRQAGSERLAMQVASLAQAQQWDVLKSTLNGTLARDPDMLSLAVREQDGEIRLAVGNHARHWVKPTSSLSTLTHVSVPLLASGRPWGTVEVSYRPVVPDTLGSWLRQPVVLLFLIVVPAGFLMFYLYILRTLRYLDPNSAVPDRVRTAFDTFNEGVIVTDGNGQIMLTNRAFRALHPAASQDLVGKPLAGQSWLTSQCAEGDLPWVRVLKNNAAVTDQHCQLAQPDGGVARLVVNAAPVQDGNGRVRGCMITIRDETQLHQAYEKMRGALADLVDSRRQIEAKNAELERLATRDPLSGCLNRRAFFAIAEPLLEQAGTLAQPVGCIMCDIDHFKRVNDGHGHAVGDQVIVSVAHLLTAALRTQDLLCRYGGEEFCILLPNTTPEQALEIAERLRSEIERNAGAGARAVEGLRVTSSFGLAALTPDLAGLNELIELADHALYASKHTGRNRVTLWRKDMPLMDDADTDTAVAA